MLTEVELEIDTVFLRSGYLVLDKKYIFVKHAQTSPLFQPKSKEITIQFFSDRTVPEASAGAFILRPVGREP